MLNNLLLPISLGGDLDSERQEQDSFLLFCLFFATDKSRACLVLLNDIKLNTVAFVDYSECVVVLV